MKLEVIYPDGAAVIVDLDCETLPAKGTIVHAKDQRFVVAHAPYVSIRDNEFSPTVRGAVAARYVVELAEMRP